MKAIYTLIIFLLVVIDLTAQIHIPDFNSDSLNSDVKNYWGLKPINKSKNKFEIRLMKNSWCDDEFLYDIFLKNDKWYFLKYTTTWNKQKLRSENQKKYLVSISDTSILRIVKNLVELDIFTLPSNNVISRKCTDTIQKTSNGEEIEFIKSINERGDTITKVVEMIIKRISHTDGYSYSVELKHGEKFRTYWIDMPEMYYKEFPRVKELENFCKILKILTIY